MLEGEARRRISLHHTDPKCASRDATSPFHRLELAKVHEAYQALGRVGSTWQTPSETEKELLYGPPPRLPEGGISVKVSATPRGVKEHTPVPVSSLRQYTVFEVRDDKE